MVLVKLIREGLVSIAEALPSCCTLYQQLCAWTELFLFRFLDERKGGDDDGDGGDGEAL